LESGLYYGIKPVPTKPSLRWYWWPSVNSVIRILLVIQQSVMKTENPSVRVRAYRRSQAAYRKQIPDKHAKFIDYRSSSSSSLSSFIKFTEGHQYRRTDSLVGTDIQISIFNRYLPTSS